jgi:rod shape-determining protein MreD
MPFARFLLGLAVAAVAHFVGTRALPVFPLAVDLFLVVTLLVARSGRPVPAMFAGVVCGWAADALAGGPFGIHGLADTIVGFGSALAAQQLVVQRKTSLLSVFAAGAAAQSAILAGLAIVFLPGGDLPALAWLPVKVATTAVAGLAWTGVAAAVSLRWSRRRRKRPSGVVNLDR